MSGMIDRAAKSPFLHRMDHMSELRHAFDAQSVLNDFNPASALSTLDVCKKYGVAVSPEDATHVANEWLSTNGWFTNPNNERIIRRGLFEAVKKVYALDLPLDVYWICYPPEFNQTSGNGLGKDYPIEIYHAVSARQVTVFIVTPAPDVGTGTADEPNMWVTKFDGAAGTVVTRAVKI
jgi:hypothetical protein